MNIENLLLFIYEIAFLKDIKITVYNEGDYMIEYPFNEEVITKSLISQINLFLENTFLENKEILQVIFTNISLFEDYLIGNYNILDYQTVIKLISDYKGIDGYTKLVSQIDTETANKINLLVIKFLDYYNEMIRIYNEKYTGYKRIKN